MCVYICTYVYVCVQAHKLMVSVCRYAVKVRGKGTGYAYKAVTDRD